jgi:hypothetical protein
VYDHWLSATTRLAVRTDNFAVIYVNTINMQTPMHTTRMRLAPQQCVTKAVVAAAVVRLHSSSSSRLRALPADDEQQIPDGAANVSNIVHDVHS